MASLYSKEQSLEIAVGDRVVRFSPWCQGQGVSLHPHEAAEQAF